MRPLLRDALVLTGVVGPAPSTVPAASDRVVGCRRPRHLARDRCPDRLARVGRDGRCRDQPEGPIRLVRGGLVPDDRRDHGDDRRTRPAGVGQRGLVFRHGCERGQAGRRRQRPCRGVCRHDRKALVVLHRITGQQAEVDPRRGDPRAVGQDDREPILLGLPDPRRGGGDLVVDFEVDQPGRHRQTFIARSTRRKAASSGSSDVWSSIAW